jgi:alkylation response protein AidB-like acyl-CoA dehydrogenase
MRAMFHMMNEARLLVGLQGFAFATAAYLYALGYAKERIQGKHLLHLKDPNAPSIPIIQHPDVRRQLLTMKVYVEGIRSLLYYIGLLSDKIAVSDTPDKKAVYQGIIDVLIPIAKGYVTDRSFDVCNIGIQIYGGYGYIKDYPMEQLLRDCRITMIYEGTNGIQAMDLLGRKLGLNDGKSVMDLLGVIQKTLSTAKNIPILKDETDAVERAVNKLAEVALQLGAAAASPKVLDAFAFAYPFMEAAGDVVMAWLLLWRAAVAADALKNAPNKKDTAFYEGQLKNAEFFTQVILPVTFGKMEAILMTNGAAVDISEASFGG